MLAISLGRRYERLLFFTAPLSLICLLVLFIAIATNSQKERLDARCFVAAADAIDENNLLLFKLWLKKYGEPAETWAGRYERGIAISAIHAGESGCMDAVKSAAKDWTTEPEKFAAFLRASAQKLRSSPISLYGVELPEKATVGVFGTDVKIGLNTVDQVLKIALAPILLLWLGSIYNTRYRESLLIGEAPSIFDVFPHIINVYPVGTITAPRKRSRLAVHAPVIARAWYTAIRVSLLSVFIVPPVAAYIASLVLAPIEFSGALTWALCILVALFALSTLAVETLPWHFKRIFPSPELIWND